MKSFETQAAAVASVSVIMSQSINRGTPDRNMPVTKVFPMCQPLEHVVFHLTLTITPGKVIVRPIVQKGN